jgi:hypothetical protein
MTSAVEVIRRLVRPDSSRRFRVQDHHPAGPAYDRARRLRNPTVDEGPGVILRPLDVVTVNVAPGERHR